MKSKTDRTPNPGPPPPLPPEFAEPALVIPPVPPLPDAPPLPAVEADTAAPEQSAPEKAEPVLDDAEPVVEAEAEEAPALVDQPEAAEDPAGDDDDVPPMPLAVVEPEPEPEPEPETAPEHETPHFVEAVTIEAVFEGSDEAPTDDAIDPATAALTLRGVTKSFGGVRAVEGIDLTVPVGTFYGLVGPNGAGKTTTLSMIAGLLQPDRGSIHVGGVDAASHSLKTKRMMGVLPDRLRTFDRLTGRQLLYYYGVLRGLAPAVVEKRTGDLARAFDLTEALGRPVSDYSAGMTKKVMLAGAMIHSPRLLVLDEPFEAVDPVSSAIILDILSAYVAHGGTVILSSHGMDLVQRVCTRVAVIVAGQVLAEGTVAEVRGELTLEQRFIELAGGLSDVEGLEWLHTFSD